ncbi:aryl-sulfate sulfotransferase, partial [candidate division KSB1 bacterium]|nr:aryl-sulfate sulfotransferase [candidate division KSB1 bacterium]
DSFYAKHGYYTDEHELQVFENGYYSLIAIRELQVDMSQYVEGGQKNAVILESCLQEFTPEGDMIFQWRAWDHMNIADTQVPGESELKSNYIRYPHMNSIDIDDDGHILLSSRHASEVTKINHSTGEVIWRFGGEKNQFTILNDPLNGPENQHDVRCLGNNRYILFDNGNEHNPRVSRAVEYEINAEDKIATLVWEFRDTPDKYAHYMGNAQRLPNGNTLINWAEGNLPKITEVRPNGEKAFEMNWEKKYDTYRVFRFPWKGKARVPYLIIQPEIDHITFLFNKFGDPDVDYYKIYGGPEPESIALLDTSRVTKKTLTDLPAGQIYFFTVTAVSKSGEESDFSNFEMAMIGEYEANKNMVREGDFSINRPYYWGLYCEPPSSATASFADSVCHIEITNGGPEFWYVQFYQPFFTLIKGEDYLFEFDAWADEARNIMVWICKAEPPNTNYGRTSTVRLEDRKKHYSYPFTMRSESDYNVIMVFFFGGSDVDAYLDNISLIRVVESEVEQNPDQIPLQCKIEGNYPNPFNAKTSIRFSVLEQSKVKLEIYNVLGQFEQEITDGIYESGIHNVVFDANQLSTGIYFIRMTVKGKQSRQTWRDFHKMLLVK